MIYNFFHLVCFRTSIGNEWLNKQVLFQTLDHSSNTNRPWDHKQWEMNLILLTSVTHFGKVTMYRINKWKKHPSSDTIFSFKTTKIFEFSITRAVVVLSNTIDYQMDLMEAYPPVRLIFSIIALTRMHSSRMRTARSLTVSRSICCGTHAPHLARPPPCTPRHTPPLPRMPPATYAPRHARPPPPWTDKHL